MKRRLSRLAADYGIFLPLLLLCAYFSWATMADHSPEGESAARQVAGEIRRAGVKNVLIAAGKTPQETEFADALEADLANAGVNVVGVVRGEPTDARKFLLELKDAGRTLDAVACSRASSQWGPFADYKSDYAALGDFQVLAPQTYRWPRFLTASNLRGIAGQIAIIAIIAIGMTMVIITGGIDLSVGSLMALGSVLAAILLRDCFQGHSAGIEGIVIACAAAIALCGLLGACTGGIVAYLDLPPFIVTLAVMLIGKGAAGIVSDSQSINAVPDSISWLGLGADLYGIPNSVVLMLVLYTLAHVVMSRMRFGRYVYAVGGNREAARLSGVPVKRILVLVYVAAGLFAGLGGVLMLSQFRGASFNYANDNYELAAITAVVVGGTSLSGGEGSMFGTLLGAFTIGVITKGLMMMNVGSHGQAVAYGAIILAAVSIDKLRRRK